jgi:flavodoxin
MKALVVYDSVFGNTEQVAQAMAEALIAHGEATARRVGETTADDLSGLDLLVVGSPTRAFSPTGGTKAFLQKIPARALTGVKVAAFDTRIAVEETHHPILTPMVMLFGYAAKPIARSLRRHGGELAAPPAGFVVEGSEGPMREGELDRAAAWATRLAESAGAR